MTYDIFAPADSFAALPEDDDEPSPRSRPYRPLLIGAAVACVVGVALGAWAKPAPPPPRPKPAPVAPAKGRVTIVLGAPAATAPPLSVLPEDAPPATTPEAKSDCSLYGALAERMVCVDPQLAAADRSLSEAVSRLEAGGAAPEGFGRDQARWLAERERAAAESPEALEAAYVRRLAQIEALTPAAS